MKNIRLLLLFLLAVNCTADVSGIEETSEESLNLQRLDCVDDLPTVRITNNGVHSFDFIIYDFDDDYNQLYNQTVTIAANSSWIELPSSSVIIVASNEFDYGQKVHVDLENCDTIDVEIDASDILTVL